MNRLSGIFLFAFTAFCHAAILSASGDGEPASRPESRALTVQEAVQMALAHSPDVLLAEAQASRAGESLRETRSLNRPQVVVGTGLAYNNGFPLSIEGAAPSIFQIGASQSILIKKNANLIREAEESGKASRLGAESARNDLALKTALVYYELYREEKIIALASERLDDARKQLELVETLFEAGRVRPVDVTMAKNRTASAQQQLLEAREHAKTAEAELRELTGLSDAVSVKTKEPRIDIPAEFQEEMIYKQALENNPEIRQAEINVRAKEFHVEAEKGERLPQMEIVSEYALFSRTNNYADYFNQFKRHNVLLGLSLQMPLFNGSRTSARVAQSRQEVSEGRLRLQRLKSDLKLSIQKGLSDLRIARGAKDVARGDVQAAREMLRVNETLLESGRITEKELEDFRSQLQQKELALLEADQILFQRKLELFHAVGSIASAID
jgi:outer membrane protein